MPRGDKSSYTGKQRRKAEHIEDSYRSRGVPEGEAERRAWATVNKESGGAKKSGSGRGRRETHVASRKGGRLGGRASAARPAAQRRQTAKKAAATRKRRSNSRAFLSSWFSTRVEVSAVARIEREARHPGQCSRIAVRKRAPPSGLRSDSIRPGRALGPKVRPLGVLAERGSRQIRPG
jgi:hypothetical protein